MFWRGLGWGAAYSDCVSAPVDCQVADAVWARGHTSADSFVEHDDLAGAHPGHRAVVLDLRNALEHDQHDVCFAVDVRRRG